MSARTRRLIGDLFLIAWVTFCLLVVLHCAPVPPGPAVVPLGDEPAIDGLLLPPATARPMPTEHELLAEVAAREAETVTAQDAIDEKGWRLTSVGALARVAAWYYADPFWTRGLYVGQPANMESAGYWQVKTVNVNGKLYDSRRFIAPRATINVQWQSGEGASQGRHFNAILVVRPSPITFAKWSHATETLVVDTVELQRSVAP